MKKIFLLSCAFLLLTQFSNAQKKTAIGLTEDQVATLKKQNPAVVIDLYKYDPQLPQQFGSLADAQNYIDSVKKVIDQTVTIPERQVSLSSGKTEKFAPCDCGSYTAYAGSAGLFTSFNVSFNYCNSVVSNSSLNVNGLQFGWSWGGNSSTHNGLYACNQGTATFGIGIFSWSQTVRVMWHLNPNTCVFYYTVSSGSCGNYNN